VNGAASRVSSSGGLTIIDRLMTILDHPWIAIWMSPRETMRRIVNHDASHQVVIIAAIAGGLATLNLALSASLGIGPSLLPPVLVPYLPVWTFLSPFIGAGLGVASVYVTAAVFQWAGYFMGGVGGAGEVRAATAWSLVPQIWFGVVVLAILLASGLLQALYPSLPPADPGDALAAAKGFTVERGAAAIISLWSFIVFLHCLGEVHRFSAWRSLAAFVLVVAALVLVSFAVSLAIV
jgi:Yip1 domain